MSISRFWSQTRLPAQILSRQPSAALLGFAGPSFFFSWCIHHNKQQTQRDGCPQQDGALISVHREAPSDSFIPLSATCRRLASNVSYNHNWPSQPPSRLGLSQMACSTMKNVPKFAKRTSSLALCLLIFSHVCPASAKSNRTEWNRTQYEVSNVLWLSNYWLVLIR